MVENLQNPNPNTTPDQPVANDAKKDASASQDAPAAKKMPELDLSGLADTVANFTVPKGDENKTKLEFLVSSGMSTKDKAMQDALFEKTFLDKITKTVLLAVLMIILAFFGYVFQEYLKFVQGQKVPTFLEYYMPSVHQGYLAVASLFGQNPDLYGTNSLTNDKAQQTLNSIITDRSLNYITKKEALTKNV